MTSKIEKNNNTCYISKNIIFFIVLISIWYIYNKLENTTWFTKHKLFALDILFYILFTSYFTAYFCSAKGRLPIIYKNIIVLIINVIMIGFIIFLDNYNDNYHYDSKYDFSKNMILLKNKVFIKENTTIIIAKVFKYIILFYVINSFINLIYENLFSNTELTNYIESAYYFIIFLIIYLLIKLILIFYKQYVNVNTNNMYNLIVNYLDYVIILIFVIFLL